MFLNIWDALKLGQGNQGYKIVKCFSITGLNSINEARVLQRLIPFNYHTKF